MRVGLLDDDGVVREAAQRSLSRRGHSLTVFERPEELERAVRAGSCPEVIFCELASGGERAATLMRTHAPGAVLVALTRLCDDEQLFGALAAGFTGYLLKPVALESLGALAEDAASGGAPMSPEIARRVVRKFQSTAPVEGSASLSPREREVLRFLAEGYCYEQVGLHLDISLASVRTYVRRLYAKLGVRTKSEATAIALRARLIA